MSSIGTATAQRLADAFADGDWETVRELNPGNPYTDEDLTAGFAGLVDQEVVLVGQRTIDSDTIALYLMLFAYEDRPAPQTSTYCVRWDYHDDTGTIVQQLGLLLDRIDGGFSRDSLGGAWTCDNFESSSMVDSATADARGHLIGPEIDDPGVIEFEGNTYECEPPPHLLGVARACTSASAEAVSEPTLLCSVANDAGTLWDCTDEDYYPDELEGLSVGTIGEDEVLCDTDWCWLWDGQQSPLVISQLTPDYRCAGDVCELW